MKIAVFSTAVLSNLGDLPQSALRQPLCCLRGSSAVSHHPVPTPSQRQPCSVRYI